MSQTTSCQCHRKYNLGRAAAINRAGTVTKEKMASFFLSTFNLSEGNYLGVGDGGRGDSHTGS